MQELGNIITIIVLIVARIVMQVYHVRLHERKPHKE